MRSLALVCLILICCACDTGTAPTTTAIPAPTATLTLAPPPTPTPAPTADKHLAKTDHDVRRAEGIGPMASEDFAVYASQKWRVYWEAHNQNGDNNPYVCPLTGDLVQVDDAGKTTGSTVPLGITDAWSPDYQGYHVVGPLYLPKGQYRFVVASECNWVTFMEAAP